MKRWLATVLVFGISFGGRPRRRHPRADDDGRGRHGRDGPCRHHLSPKMTTRIKGLKSRTDMEMPPSVNASVDHRPRGEADDPAAARREDRPDRRRRGRARAAPRRDGDGERRCDPPAPTGKSQVIDGFKCDEYTFTTTMNMAEMTGPQLPPEAAEMMKGLTMVMKGSMWVTKDAPGAAEYLAYQKALAKADLAARGD